MFSGGGKDAVGRDHHPEVDHFIVVATQHHTDDVLANVVYITLYSGEQHFPIVFGCSARLRLLGFKPGGQLCYRFLHNAGTLDHLRQEHFSAAEKVAHLVHAVHQRTFNDLKGKGIHPHRLLDINVDELVITLDQ